MTKRRPDKATLYKRVRISGLLTLIPITLAVSPLAGYWAGEWLTAALKAPGWAPIACAALGFAGGVLETVKIIRAALGSLNNKGA